MQKIGLVAFALVLTLSTAFAQEGASGPQSYNPDPGRLPFNHTLTVRDGETRVHIGDVRAGDILLSIPVRHCQTGILLDDIEVPGIFRPTHVASAGARGYLVHDADINVRNDNGALVAYFTQRHDVWCFLTNAEGEALRSRCVERSYTERYEVFGEGALVSGAYALSLPAGSTNEFRVEPRYLEFVEDLRMEYVMRAWTRTRALIALKVNGEVVTLLHEDWSPSGRAAFVTPLGRLTFDQHGTNPQRALATLVPYDRAVPLVPGCGPRPAGDPNR